MRAMPSSSTRKPIETTLSVPGGPPGRTDGTSTSLGWIFPSLPPRRALMPSMRGTEKPQMSASRTPTV